ncbi:MAG TPA: hypothetical protein VJ963_08635 [Bacteroidales bacterium]|nr:hypothetical protein [Bacteroidales bacterium]
MKSNVNNIKSFQDIGWLKLDNAANLFPAISSNDLTSVFRITASLKTPVRYSVLREAVEITSKRFSYFSVSLGSGLFWHFLEYNNQMPRIQIEEKVPCTAFAFKRKNEPLYRILAKGSRISVEFIHILTDGGGALEYLKSLLYTYLTLTGIRINSPGDIILPDTPVSEEELQDSYNKFFRKMPPPAKLVRAWHLPFKLDERPRLKVIRAEINVDQIRETAKKYNVSITEYLISVYLFSLQKIYISVKSKKQKYRVLRIEVPINLRNKFKSRTMRNFSLFMLPEIDMRLGTYTFEEIVLSVHHQLMLSSDTKQISRFLSSNVSYEKLLFVRILPLFIKKLAITAIFRNLASKRWTGLITNLGLITLPQEMEEMIEYFELIPPPPNLKLKVGSAIISFKNKLRITFCNITLSNELERLILKHLSDSGIHVKILNNK